MTNSTDRTCVCKYCGKTFEADSPADARRRKYCSRHCSSMASVEKRTGQRWADLHGTGKDKADPNLPKNLHCCATCAYAVKDRLDRKYAFKEIGCSCVESDFYGCILNANRNGVIQATVTWTGCDKWQEQRSTSTIKKRLSVPDFKKWALLEKSRRAVR